MSRDFYGNNFRGQYPRPNGMPVQYLTVRTYHASGLYRAVLMLWNSDSGVYYGAEFGRIQGEYCRAWQEAKEWAARENLEVLESNKEI